MNSPPSMFQLIGAPMMALVHFSPQRTELSSSWMLDGNLTLFVTLMAYLDGVSPLDANWIQFISQKQSILVFWRIRIQHNEWQKWSFHYRNQQQISAPAKIPISPYPLERFKLATRTCRGMPLLWRCLRKIACVEMGRVSAGLDSDVFVR